MGIEIERVTPSEALRRVYADSQLVRLIMAGYDLTDKEKENPIEATRFEYHYEPDSRATFFLAHEGNEVVGSFGLIMWPDNPEDTRGKLFWPQLQELDPKIAARARAINPLACDVGGVVILPDYRKRKIANMLLIHGVDKVNPSIIVGNTKTVAAVALRRSLPGFRTFYGNTEITPGHEQSKTDDHAAIVNAYLYAKEFGALLRENNLFVYKGGIAPTIPDVNGFPDIIQTAFSPLISAQKDTTETLMAPLISVRQEILEK